MKRPPSERHRRRVQDPVRIQPLDDVRVARDGDELRARTTDVLLDCVCTDARHLTIHHGRKLVHDHQLRALDEQTRHLDAEPLAVRQHVVGAQPRGNGVEPDRVADRCDVFELRVLREVVEDARALPLHRPRERVTEQGTRHGRLPAARGTDDQADVPLALLERHVARPSQLLTFTRRDIEQRFDLPASHRARDVRSDYNVNSRHSSPLRSSSSQSVACACSSAQDTIT